MAQFNNLKTDFQKAKENFAAELDTLRADFALYYCLSETIEQCDRVMKENPSREISLVKTKLQEAIFWLNEI